MRPPSPQVLPPYRTRFSKHQFTQPQLLAVLCLMRYEDWTFREAETRLREHQELRAALKLREVPDYTTLYRFLRRLDDVTVERGLGETVRRLRRRRRRAVSVAIDGTGLSYNSVSTFFIRRLEQHADRSARHRHWLKWVIVVDVQQQILLAQRAHQGPGSDVRSLPGLLDVAARGAPIRLVLADAEFDSEPNHQHIRQRLGAKSIIPAKRRGIPQGTIRNQMFRAFPEKPYRQRAKQDRNHLLGDQTQAFLPRSRAQLIYTDSPSPAARSCLQPLSLEASPHLGGCQQSQCSF